MLKLVTPFNIISLAVVIVSMIAAIRGNYEVSCWLLLGYTFMYGIGCFFKKMIDET